MNIEMYRFEVGHKFKVGDKVEVFGLVHERGEYYYFAPEMDKYIGCVTRVREVIKDGSVKIDVDGGFYSWHPRWLGSPTGVRWIGRASDVTRGH